MSVCAECGMNLPDGPGEYHPYAFCVMWKAGLKPWQEIRVICGQLGLPDPGETPPRSRLSGSGNERASDPTGGRSPQPGR